MNNGRLLYFVREIFIVFNSKLTLVLYNKMCLEQH